MVGSFISSRSRTTLPSATIGETPVPKSPSVGGGGHFVAPELLAGQVVAEEAAGAEVGDDVLAIGGARGGGGAAFVLLVELDLGGRGLGTPKFAAIGAAIGDRVELAVVKGGEEELVADDHRRRDSAGDGRPSTSRFCPGRFRWADVASSAMPEALGPRNWGQGAPVGQWKLDCWIAWAEQARRMRRRRRARTS